MEFILFIGFEKNRIVNDDTTIYYLIFVIIHNFIISNEVHNYNHNKQLQLVG